MKIGDAVREPVDLVVNLVAGSRDDTVVLLDVTRPGGILVSATSPGGEFPGDVRVVFFSVHSDRAALAQIVTRVENGTLFTSTSPTNARSPSIQPNSTPGTSAYDLMCSCRYDLMCPFSAC